ncbi:adenosine A3 receptor-like protein [Dinothrombium tinctorium]|uniref:Adenosine A3 receptor-like protein n=1 Tax=Dinothrombium tinctorium TaxID=1965070 RepID=A0A443QT22_9ACAR|nr:adenosine A3 receptor-like protein [Dinothrombium tinctorium]
MSSWQCTFSGFLATFSSELSVFIVALITVERYRSITSDFAAITFKLSSIMVSVFWLLAMILALFPLIYWSDKDDKVYYASNGVCFPLHIEEPFMIGWQFSAIMFMGINLPSVLLIIALYLKMFLVIKSDRKFARPALNGKKKEDVILALRFFFIVLTDCLCWIPIIVIKLIAFADIEISPSIYAWLIVFILPVNSALNPIIYTLAAPTELRRRIQKYLQQVYFAVERSLFGKRKHERNSTEGSSSQYSHTTGISDQNRSSDGSVMSMANSITLKTHRISK